MLISSETISSEFNLLATVIVSVVCYLLVTVFFLGKNRFLKATLKKNHSEQNYPEHSWNDTHTVIFRHPLTAVQNHAGIFYLTAFSCQSLAPRTASQTNVPKEPKLCVSRSPSDTDKLMHPLIKRIESRLRRAEIRPRPRLRVERTDLPHPLYSSTRADNELSKYVVAFIDACIELSSSCDTQVSFQLDCVASGVSLSAIWKKNQLIADATAQIELLDDMRLTMSGETIRWEYQLFTCPIEIMQSESTTALPHSA